MYHTQPYPTYHHTNPPPPTTTHASYYLGGELDTHHANGVLGKIAVAGVETSAASPRAARSDRRVGDAGDGSIKTRHVGRASVQKILGAETKRVAVDESVERGKARVLLPLLHVAVVRRLVVDRALVVIEQNGARFEGVSVVERQHTGLIERHTREVEPVVTDGGPTGDHTVLLAHPQELLYRVVEANVVLLHGRCGNVGLLAEVLHLIKDVLVLAVGERATLDLVEVDVETDEVGLVGRGGHGNVANRPTADLVELSQGALVDDDVHVVPVQADHGERLLKEAAEPEAERRVETLGVLRGKHALEHGGELADHVAKTLLGRCHDGVHEFHVLAGVLIKLMLTDLELSIDDLGVAHGIDVPGSRDGAGGEVVRAGSAVVGNGSDLVILIELGQEIASTGHLGRHARATIAGVAAERNLELGDGKVGVAGIAGLPESQLVGGNEVRVLGTAHAQLNHGTGRHVLR